jgi:hypothetical protein
LGPEGFAVSFRFAVDHRFVAGGASLDRLWNACDGKGTARAKIQEKKWDHVVLQDIYYVKPDGLNKYATLFHELIPKNGS